MHLFEACLCLTLKYESIAPVLISHLSVDDRSALAGVCQGCFPLMMKFGPYGA